MKRQHPTDPNLFWCPKCWGYKGKDGFYKDIHDFNGISHRCVECEKALEYARIYRAREKALLTDRYVSSRLRNSGVPITQELIHMKRTELEMKGTLEQIKSWRRGKR